ncbi:MAG: BrnA antitoxin family protein [Mariprofundaceae bacterium]|nr:BrnA antitoxin family protein [Mariprofundaceae bacterium]
MLKKRKLIMPTDEEDATINAGIAADPDANELSQSFFKHAIATDKLPLKAQRVLAGVRGLQKKTKKESTTIRLDHEVTTFYGKGKKGWQTRVNQDLVKVSRIHKGESAWVKRDAVTGELIIHPSRE